MSLKEMEQEQALIRQVFGTDSGKKLLKRLVDQYVLSPQLHADPYILYSRIGVQELIVHLMTVTGETK